MIQNIDQTIGNEQMWTKNLILTEKKRMLKKEPKKVANTSITISIKIKQTNKKRKIVIKKQTIKIRKS